PAVSPTTHTLLDPITPHHLPELPARIMTTLIAVEHHPAGFTTGFPCHFQRFHGEPAVRRERHGPAHWFSCEQVENNGEVRPALTRPEYSKRQGVVGLFPCLSSPNRTCTFQRIRLSI